MLQLARKSTPFLSIAASQVSISLPTYIVVIVATRELNHDDVVKVASLTFFGAFVISFTRAFLSSSLVIKASGDENLLRALTKCYLIRDFQILFLTSATSTLVFAITIHPETHETLLCFLLSLVLCIADYFRQINFAMGKIIFMGLSDILSLIFFMSLTLITAFGKSFSFVSLVGIWIISSLLPSLITIIRTKIGSFASAQLMEPIWRLRLSLLGDYLAGLGLLQLTYMFAPSLSSSQDATSLRLVLLVTGPSAILAQALTVSGITMLMSDEKSRRPKLFIAGALIAGSTALTCSVLYLSDSSWIDRHLGQAWLGIHSFLPMAMIMSASHGLLIQSSIPIRWQANPRLIMKIRLLSVPASLLGPSLGLMFYGVNGCLAGLTTANLVTWWLGRHFLSRTLKMRDLNSQ